MTEQSATARAHAKQKRVTIILTENPKNVMVVPDMLRLNKVDGDAATWECPQGHAFEVVFDRVETPFSGHHFDQTNAKNLEIRSDVKSNGHRPFKYTVRVTGYPELDPAVIVDP